MRIALLCPYSWSVPGGVQSHVAGLARALRAREHDVEIIAPADGPVSLEGFIAAGPSIPILDNGSWVRVALDPISAARTARLVRSGGYDLVHLHEPMIPAVCLTALFAAEAPLVGTFHMYAARPRWYRLFSPLARRALPRLDARIAVSEAALRHVSRTCPGDYHVVANGIDTAAFDVRGERTGQRILFIGRSEPRKGLHVLLDAFARLPGRLHLDLVGVTPKQLRILARGLPGSVTARVHARGSVSDEERARLLASADVLCAPSLEGESFGIVLVEGMAARAPVVASAIPGYVDVLPGSCGVLVPPGSVDALTSTLGELMADPGRRQELGAAGRTEAARYDWARVAEEILAVYDQALKGYAAKPKAGGSPRARDRAAAGSRARSGRAGSAPGS